jgi:hypothetical protein
MTRREILLSVSTLAIGLAVGALLYGHCQTPPKAPVAPHEDPVTEDDPPDDPRAVPEPSPVPDVDAPPSDVADDAGAADAAPGPAGQPHKAPRLRLKNLFIHPASDERLCVNVAPGSSALELLACRGHKGTERWTFVEDPSGTSQIRGKDGDCMQIGPLSARGEPTMELAACTRDTPRFRHTEDRRLEDVHSGQCVTARAVEKRATLILAVCDPNARSGTQTWALTP